MLFHVSAVTQQSSVDAHFDDAHKDGGDGVGEDGDDGAD